MAARAQTGDGGGGGAEGVQGIPEKVLRMAAEKGISVADVPTAVVVHEAAGLGVMMAAWAACFYARPTRALYRSAALQRAAPSFRARADALVARVRASRAFEVVSRRVSERVAVALAESSVVRRAVSPVTVPLKLWVTWKFFELRGKTEADGVPAAPEGASR